MTQQDKPVERDEFDKNFDAWWDGDYDDSSNPYRIGTPIYWAWAGWAAKPQQRTWVGLMDEELAEFSDAKLGSYDLCLEVEAKLKEKNA